MKIGSSIVLLVLGAIFAFAVRDNLDFMNLTFVGYILIGAGALGLILTLVLANRSTRHTTQVTDSTPSQTGHKTVETESSPPPQQGL